MHVKTEVTELLAHTDEFTYRVSQHKGEWTIRRWKTGNAPIPPLMEVLLAGSTRGLYTWCNLIKASRDGMPHAAKFESDVHALCAAMPNLAVINR